MRVEEAGTTQNELEAWRLLPWLANDTLEGEDLERVLEYLGSSRAAREELLFLSELRHAVETTSRDQFEPSAERLGRLMQRIDEHEADRTATRSPSVALFERKAARRREWVAWGAAAAAVLLLVSVLWRVPWIGAASPDEGSVAMFRTMSEEDAVREHRGPVAAATHIRVVFDGASAEAAIRELLLELELEIVSGPTAGGAYSLRMATAGQNDGVSLDLLKRLRQDERIALAEVAVDG